MTPKPESETDPWAKVTPAMLVVLRTIENGEHEIVDCPVCQGVDALEALMAYIDAARAAEAAQHRQEMEERDGFWLARLADSLKADHERIEALRAERDRLKAALQGLQSDIEHDAHVNQPEAFRNYWRGRLHSEIAALTPQGQSTDGETR